MTIEPVISSGRASTTYSTIEDVNSIYPAYSGALGRLCNDGFSTDRTRMVAATFAAACMARGEHWKVSFDIFCRFGLTRPNPLLASSHDAIAFLTASLGDIVSEKKVINNFVSLLQSSVRQAVAEYGLRTPYRLDGRTMLLVSEMYSDREEYFKLPRAPKEPAVNTITKTVKDQIDLASLTLTGVRIFPPPKKAPRSAEVSRFEMSCLDPDALFNFERALSLASGLKLTGVADILLEGFKFTDTVKIPSELETALPIIMTLSRMSGALTLQTARVIQNSPSRLITGLANTSADCFLLELRDLDHEKQMHALSDLAGNSLIVSKVLMQLFSERFDVAIKLLKQRVPNDDERVYRSLETLRKDMQDIFRQAWK